MDKYDQEHRLNNLPAVEYGDIHYISYLVKGRNHRTNGPARINNNSKWIEWWKDGENYCIVGEYEIKLGSQGEFKPIDFATYKELVNKEFPEAKGKIRYEDWIK